MSQRSNRMALTARWQRSRPKKTQVTPWPYLSAISPALFSFHCEDLEPWPARAWKHFILSLKVVFLLPSHLTSILFRLLAILIKTYHNGTVTQLPSSTVGHLAKQ